VRIAIEGKFKIQRFVIQYSLIVHESLTLPTRAPENKKILSKTKSKERRSLTHELYPTGIHH